MAERKPEPLYAVYIIHGDDLYGIQQHVRDLCCLPDFNEFDTVRLDGKQQALDDLLYANTHALPFFSPRRLVLVSAPFTRLQNDAARKKFLAVLNDLPPTTSLALVVEDEWQRKERDWRSLPANKPGHWMRKWITAAAERVSYQPCKLPSLNEMPRWILAEARRRGGAFQQDAASALVGHVGTNTHMAALEIEKLLTYVDGRHPVETQDVEELVAQTGQADIFQMVDALAAGNTRQALSLYHRLLEQQEPQLVFAMIVRQFRLLLMAREVLDEGRGAQMAVEIHQSPFVAEKTANQARSYRMSQLVAIYHRLLEIDEAFKTGQMPLDLALDTLIADIPRS